MIKSLTALLTIIFLLFIPTAQASMNSANYTITSAVISGGGGPVSSSSYYSNAALGQPVVSEPVSSTEYDLYSGFWYTLLTRGCIWDLDPETGDGDVDGLDLFRFINPPYNASDIEGFGSEFGKTDCF